MIYLLTANGLTPGGSSTVYIYIKTIHRTIQTPSDIPIAVNKYIISYQPQRRIPYTLTVT